MDQQQSPDSPNPRPATPAEQPHDAGADQSRPNQVSFLQVILSVIQASFGVQNRKNRERDFTQGKFWPFVIAALLFTAIFVLTIVAVVTMVLPKK